MMKLTIKYWHAWGPSILTQDDAFEWARGRGDWGVEGVPDVRFLPAMFRRRLSRHSRMAMAALQPCLAYCSSEEVQTVFASRWGELSITAKLLEDLACRERLSPMDFSLSVHNTASGLFSIHYKNCERTCSLSGGKDTFCYAMMEAASLLHRYPDKPVLLVVSDEGLPAVYHKHIDEGQSSYALAMVLTAGSEGFAVRGACDGATDVSSLDDVMSDPQALLFLRWLLSEDASLVMNTGRRAWRWEKA